MKKKKKKLVDIKNLIVYVNTSDYKFMELRACTIVIIGKRNQTLELQNSWDART